MNRYKVSGILMVLVVGVVCVLYLGYAVEAYAEQNWQSGFGGGEMNRYGFRLQVTSELPRDLGHIPMSVEIDFGAMVQDLNGVLDLVVNGHVVQNANPDGWPFDPVEPVDLEIGKRLTFLDLDGDGKLDAMGMPVGGCEHRLTWRRNLGGNPPVFGSELPLPDVDLASCSAVRSVWDGDR